MTDIYSHYSLIVQLPEDAEHPDNAQLDIIDDLRANNEEAGYAINEDGTNRDEAKWYDAHTHLHEFSKKYPDVVFVLSKESTNPEEFGYGVIETIICNGQYT